MVDGAAQDAEVSDAWSPFDVSVADAASGDAAPTDAGPDVESPLRVDVTIDVDDFEQFYADPEDREFEPEVRVDFDGDEYEDVQMEVHGGYARRFPKLSFRFRFDNDEPLSTNAFSGDEMEEHRRVVMQASWIDPTYSRNCLTFELIRAEGGLAPRCNHAELYVNGEYHGFYVLLERVDEVFLERNGLNPAGLLLKAENHSANWADKDNFMDGMAIKVNEDADTAPYAELLEALSGTPLEYEAFQEEVASRLNLNDWMLWQGVHTFADNRDTFTKNYYLYRDPDLPFSRFRIISWDADATWGMNWDGELVEPTTMAINGHDPFSRRILRIEEYRTTYLETYALRVEALTSQESAVLARLDDRQAFLAPFIDRDLEAWDRSINSAEPYETLRTAVQTRYEIMAEVVFTEQETEEP